MITIFITDDHPLVLEGLKNVLSSEDNLLVKACFTDATSTLNALKEEQPAVLLLDINLPDINGIELVAKIKSRSPDTKVIALSVHNEYAVINSMFDGGADGYIQKNAIGDEIVLGIQTVLAGGRFLCAKSTEIMQRTTKDGLKNVPKVTRRDKEILQQAANGLTTQQIGDTLFISPHTV